MNAEQLQEGAGLLAAATPGPCFVSTDDAEECGPHRGSGLAMVDTGREGDWPIARLCEWPDAKLTAWLRTHAAELIADAGRYQWLRAECVSAEENESPAELIEHCWVDAKIRTEQDVDAAIDAARASGTEGACS